MRALPALAVVLMMVLAHATHAAAMTVVDQRAEGGFSFGHTITALAGGPTGQSFVPTVAQHAGVRLMLSGIVITPARDSDFLDLTLNVREQSIGGSIVETVQVSMSGGSLFREWVDFDFGGTLMLSPGQTYVLELVSALGNGFWHRVDGSEQLPMERRAIYAGAVQDWSWGFQTLTPIPEPTTALLMGLGLLGLTLAAPRGTR